MKRSQHIRGVFASLLVLVTLGSISCKQVNDVIQNLLTFNITKDAPAIPIPPAPITPVGITIASPGIPIGIDSADLAQQKTALSLVKTLKLTGWMISIDDSIVYPRTNIDTMTISVGTSQQSKVLLATYTGTGDKITLTNADFAPQFKNPQDSFYVTFRVKNAPPHTVNLLTSYTLTFSADPL
jgi:hypothetical protein